MAHDPKREDYLRLSLRLALSLDAADADDLPRIFASFGRRFAQDRDTLPQSDADRAFHLVVLATDLLDYRLPFAADDAQAAQLARRADALLDEAKALDPTCYDAVRMRFFTSTGSAEERGRFLADGEKDVRTFCEAERERVCEALDGEREMLAATIAMRPYWRWLAAMAECALVAGRNREAAEICERLLASDPRDLSDARFTLAYALAKLEDGPGLARLVERYETVSPMRSADDAWIVLAQLALAYKNYELGAARRLLERLLDSYPTSARSLAHQLEISDGVFARIKVAPYSEDEMVVALSEGVVLLQEGGVAGGHGALSTWVERTTCELVPAAALDDQDGGSMAGPRGAGAAPHGGGAA